MFKVGDKVRLNDFYTMVLDVNDERIKVKYFGWSIWVPSKRFTLVEPDYLSITRSLA